MGQPVVLPKFELPGDKPHWAVKAAVVAGILLLISVIGLGAVIMHRNSVETQAHLAKVEALARIKAEADAKVAAAAAAARAAKEAELAAKRAAEIAAATTLAAATPAPGGDPGTDPKSASKTPRASHGHHGKPHVGKTTTKTGGKVDASSSTKPSGDSKRNDAAIDAILSKMK